MLQQLPRAADLDEMPPDRRLGPHPPPSGAPLPIADLRAQERTAKVGL